MEQFLTDWLPWIIAIASAVTASVPMPKSATGHLIVAFIRALALNVGNAKPGEKPPVKHDIGPLVLVLLIGAGAMSMPTDSFAAALTWTLPTTRANDEPLAAADITAVTIYAGATKLATLPGNALTYTVPDCKAATYSATVTAGTLESVKSNTAELVPLAVNCAPKPPTGLRF